MKNVFAILLFLAASISGTSVAHAQPRNAKCLMEVNGVHYFGGICKYTDLGNGSFRVSTSNGLIAQINVTKHDQGKASEGQATWSGPLGHGSRELSRTDACWSNEGGADNVLICAWSMNQDVYLGPTPPEPDSSKTIDYSTRVGGFYNIISKSGVDSPYAQVDTVPSREGAIIFCRQYENDYSNKCINDLMDNDGPRTATADCPARTFVDFWGNKFKFIGKNSDTSGDIFAEFLIKDLKTGNILDGSSASGYDVAFGIYKNLCPGEIQ